MTKPPFDKQSIMSYTIEVSKIQLFWKKKIKSFVVSPNRNEDKKAILNVLKAKISFFLTNEMLYERAT